MTFHPAADLSAHTVGYVEHDGLVLKNARRFLWALKQGALEFDDLVQAGRMGVERAKLTFEPERGHQFSTYANWWIRQHIRRLVNNEGSTVRIPVQAQYDRRAQGKMAFYRRLSLEHEPADGDGLVNILDVVCPTQPDDEAPDAEELHERVRRALAELEPRERQVLTVRFYRQEGTLDDAGKALGVSRERARQVESKALAKLRAKLTGENWRQIGNLRRKARMGELGT